MKTKILILFLVLLLALSIASVSALTITSVSSSPRESSPGQKVTMTLTLENELDRELEDVSIKLNLEALPIAPYGQGAEKTIDRIKKDRIKIIDFELVVNSDAKSQTYKIPVEISYKEDSLQVTKKDFVSLAVKSIPKIAVSSSDYLIKGQENKFNIKVINKGLEDVKFLNIKISPSTKTKILSSPEDYVGDLNSDDTDAAEFSIFVEQDSGSNIKIPVQIEYKDSTTKEYTESFELSLKAYSKKEAESLGLIKKSNTGIYAGLIIFVILVFIIFRIRRRKLKAEE